VPVTQRPREYRPPVFEPASGPCVGTRDRRQDLCVRAMATSCWGHIHARNAPLWSTDISFL